MNFKNAAYNYLKKITHKFKSISLMILSFCAAGLLIAHSIAFAGDVCIVTHGFGNNMEWVEDAADKLISRNGGDSIVAEYMIKITEKGGFSILNQNGTEFGSKANTNGFAVVKLDWTEISGELKENSAELELDRFTFGTHTGLVAEFVVDRLMTHSEITQKLLASPIHLIGHSRGGSLVGAMAERIGDYGYWVDQVTFLDPHPTENLGFPDDWGKDEMVVPGNVIFADNYYRKGQFPSGKYVTGAENIQLDDSYFHDFGYDSGHSDVHAWYRGTIPSFDPPYRILTTENDFYITSEWYVADAYIDKEARPRETTGYAYSLIGNDGTNRTYAGIHAGINGSGQVRSFDPIDKENSVNNVGYLTLRNTSVRAGDTFKVDYRYESWSLDFGVAFYLDTNKNPHDGYKIYLDGFDLGESDGMGGKLEGPASLKVPLGLKAGTYYVFIKSTGSSTPRYFYAPTPLEITEGPPPPPPGSETETFTASADTYVSEDYPTYKFGNSWIIAVQSKDGTDNYGLVKFNLDDIPYGSVVDDVELKLYCSYADGYRKEIRISESDSSWSESSVTWNEKPPVGSNYYFGHSVSGIGYQSIKNSNLKNLVKSWVNGSESNYGIYLLPYNVNDIFYFTSSEDSNSSERPKLTVTYTPPPPPDLIVTELSPDPIPLFDQFTVGQNIDWNVTVKNNGMGPADSSSVGYYLGTSSTDLSNRINRDSIDALNKGESDSAHDLYTFTESDIGQRFLICKADYKEDIKESNENNNTRVYGPFNVVLPKVSTPTITPNGGIFTGSIQVTLSCSTSKATIRYTIDGTTPTSNSTVYTGAITINSSCTLKARGFMNGLSDSDTGSANFIIKSDLPLKAINPNPRNGEANKSITTDLSWTNGGGATSYDVYFGTNSSPDSEEYKGNQTSTNYNPGTLEYDTTYYWRIDAVNSEGTTTGDVWHFKTKQFDDPTRIIRLVGNLAFGDVKIGTTLPRVMTIYNDGDSTLTVSGISYPPGFSGNWSGPISKSSSQDVTVTFAPTATTNYGGTIWVNSDKTSGTDTIPCSGTGTEEPTRIIRLVGNLAFGDVKIGTTLPRVMTIYNDGDSTLTVSGISYPPGFSGNWSGPISKSSSQDVTVTFAPTATTNYGGTIWVNSDKTSGTDTIPCSGTGITTNVPPVVSITANASDGPITIAPGDALSVAISLDPGDFFGNNADWWVYTSTPMGQYSFNIPGGWVPGSNVTHQGPLFDLSNYTVLDNSGLPEGAYTFYFSIDVDQSYSDSVEVTVTDNPLFKAQVAAGWYHTVGLKSDGTVIAVGDNRWGQCDVESWSDIQQVAAGSLHTLGLKSDGTVVAVGNNYSGQCDVESWADIQQVEAGYGHTLGLKSDGTVVAVGRNDYGESDVESWSNIQQVTAGAHHTLGLKSDGTVVAVGYHYRGECDVESWSNIQQVAGGHGHHTLGLKSVSTVVAVGHNEYGQCDVESWADIQQVEAGYGHTLGLKSDGTVVAVGRNDYGESDVESWSNIQQVTAGYYYTIGLKSDGTVVAVGHNEYGQCNTSDWDLLSDDDNIIDLNFDDDNLTEFPDYPSPGPGRCEYSGTGQAKIESYLGNNYSNLLVLKDVTTGEKENAEVWIFPNNESQGIISIEFDIVISNNFLVSDEGWFMSIHACGSKTKNTSGSPAIFDINLTEDGYRIYGQPIKYIPCLIDQKQHFKITIDTNRQVWSATIDEEIAIIDKTFNNLEAVNFSFLGFNSFYDAKILFGIDNIVVTK